VKRSILTAVLGICVAGVIGLTACGGSGRESETVSEEVVSADVSVEPEAPTVSEEVSAEPEENAVQEALSAEPEPEPAESEPEEMPKESISEPEETIYWDDSWEYADFSKIHDDTVILYRSDSADRKDCVIAVNAGHGTSGGESVKTQCHPDGSEKVVSGSTSAGATQATAVSSGMTFNDGTPEAEATLSLAVFVKDALLDAGYDVLMIREDDDVQLDNIARTVLANQYADYHISLHYDSTESDKGAFYIGVPDAGGYRSMEPVALHWQEHEALGEAVIRGFQEQGLHVYGDGRMAIDMTQTSYSTIPSIDLEVGDKASDHSEEVQKEIAQAIVWGLDSLQ